LVCAIGATGARRKAPVVREAEKLGIANERATLEPQIARNHRFYLIEEQLCGAPPKLRNASSMPSISVAMSWRG
jgi:hypothetical protein